MADFSHPPLAVQSSPRRLLIVDDVAEVRADLRTLLDLAGGIEIVGEAANGVEAVQQVQAIHPDVVLIDLEMPLMNGYDATRKIKMHSPDSRVIALSIHGYPAAQAQARAAGVDAFIIKGAPLSDLVQEILKKE
jgi:DNA-binding NarL/FixJ family response regulator